MRAFVGVVLWLACASAAQAGTITVTITGATPTKTLTVTRDVAGTASIGTGFSSELLIGGLVGDTIDAPGCSPAMVGGVDCGAVSQYARFVFNGTSGDDRFTVTDSMTQIVEAHGGEGNDEVQAGSGPDELYGDGGNDSLVGSGGNDRLSGGPGNDAFLAGSGADVADGGPGADQMHAGNFDDGDTLDYSSRTQPVRVELDCIGYCLAGEQGEGDTVFAFREVLGGSGNDDLSGGERANRLLGGGGNDLISGGAGADDLQGGAGDDLLTGGAGVDAMAGGAGEDLLDTADQTNENVTCGADYDLLFSDLNDGYPADGPEACEVVAPFILGTVTLTGAAVEGGTLQAALAGSLAGTAATTSWQWWRCGDASCAPIAGATASSYTLVAADVGAYLFAVMRVENEAGYSELDSADLIGPIAAKPLPPIVLPPPPPPPPPAIAPAPGPARATIQSVRCATRMCIVKATITGDASRLQAVLTRGARTLGRLSRSAKAGRLTLTIRTTRTLRAGPHRLRITVIGKDAKRRSTTRAFRIPAKRRSASGAVRALSRGAS